MNKDEFIREEWLTILRLEQEDNTDALVEKCLEFLHKICDEWGFPYPEEIDKFQCKVGGTGKFVIRDRETGIVVYGEGSTHESAKKHALWLIREALKYGDAPRCWFDHDSYHSSLCTCKNNAQAEMNYKISNWDEVADGWH